MLTDCNDAHLLGDAPKTSIFNSCLTYLKTIFYAGYASCMAGSYIIGASNGRVCSIS